MLNFFLNCLLLREVCFLFKNLERVYSLNIRIPLMVNTEVARFLKRSFQLTWLVLYSTKRSINLSSCYLVLNASSFILYNSWNYLIISNKECFDDGFITILFIIIFAFTAILIYKLLIVILNDILIWNSPFLLLQDWWRSLLKINCRIWFQIFNCWTQIIFKCFDFDNLRLRIMLFNVLK